MKILATYKGEKILDRVERWKPDEYKLQIRGWVKKKDLKNIEKRKKPEKMKYTGSI